MTTLIYLLGLIISWLFFYKILTARKVRLPKIKTTIIVILFSTLIYSFSYDLYAFIDRLIFSLNKQGEVSLSNSIFKIPPNQDIEYCKQFTDENGNEIKVVSNRKDGRYCGEFWRFQRKENILLPYKKINDAQLIYWASPSLKIITKK
ncbi:hypothetical protein [Legionella cardiaca]|uniref:Transmembrane protein n=1 Tax=Legionella cardiaca TaxID=1071983 RepID=A0ABY8AMQ9_9GAMM|nr:hypothetical protein [Legionella cardiaca]WED41858.1 hypothetical protein PXX05_07890 [Legionella cardiaca]